MDEIVLNPYLSIKDHNELGRNKHKYVIRPCKHGKKCNHYSSCKFGHPRAWWQQNKKKKKKKLILIVSDVNI